MSISIYNAKTYCCEDVSHIENYFLAVNDLTNSWHCHHRLETHVYVKGFGYRRRRFKYLTSLNLKTGGLYYQRPASELIFIEEHEHHKLHNKSRFDGHGPEWKLKISKFHKNKIVSDETRKKLSDSWKHRKQHLQSEETRLKISESHKGVKHPLFGKHLDDEYKKKISESLKLRWVDEEFKLKNSLIRLGKKWWNNGEIEKLSKSQPPGFSKGRLIKK